MRGRQWIRRAEVLCVAFALCSGGGGCRETGRGAPTHPPAVIHLLESDFESFGDPPARPAELARFGAAELERWSKRLTPSVVYAISPKFAAPTREGALLRLRLRPGGARVIEVTPFLEGVRAVLQRSYNTSTASVPPGTPPDAILTLQFDLSEVLFGNWRGAIAPEPAGEEKVIERLVIGFEGANAADVALEQVLLEDARVKWTKRAAGRAEVDRGGVIRPSWYIHPGASLRVSVEVPAGGELRWHQAGSVRGAVSAVRLEDGRESVEIARSRLRKGWEYRSVSLDAWAGRRVDLRFQTSGGGVGFIGAPRIVTRGDARRAPDVLVYMIDTLRADRLGFAGRDKPALSPRLDRIAREGVRFANAISSSSWTKPAIVTLMTGVWPTTHRVGARGYADRLPLSVPTLAERFRSAGWRTGSFSANPLGSTLSALERGFDCVAPPRHWTRSMERPRNPAATELHRAMLDWLDEEPDRPIFAYVHVLEVHQWRIFESESASPGTPDPTAKPTREGLEAYDIAVREADRAFGELFDSLEARRRTDNLLIVVLSDHGESFGDHGTRGHGTSLYQSQLHIPLIFWAGESLAPRVVERPVGLPDVTTTLLDYLGLPSLPDADGLSLLPDLTGEAAPADRSIASALLHFVSDSTAPKQYALINADLEKIIRGSDGRQVIFDLVEDPEEREEEIEVSTSLSDDLDAWLAEQDREAEAFAERYGETGFHQIEAPDSELLRLMGYLE